MNQNPVSTEPPTLDDQAAKAGRAASLLFADYDCAAARLSEAREILALDPESNPAKERVDDALKRVAHEIGRWIERTSSANAKLTDGGRKTHE